MPKKSTKSKSKRVTLRQKYKVLRKVREHRRKTRKDAKKNGVVKRKEPKDPGIPAAWPFKEELIQQLAAQKERAAERERNQREEAWARKAAEEALTERVKGEDEIEAMRASAAERNASFEDMSGSDEEDAPALVDGSRRAFYKDFVKVAEASDVILEVLDARDPIGCRCKDVERFVRRIDPGKRIVLLLNKVDLVPREVVEGWLKYFREEMPAVAFKCSTQQQSTNLGRAQKRGKVAAPAKTSNCLGADVLLQLLKNYARNAGLKTSLTVGVVGLPNVGKSSLINSLKRAKVAQVGNTPGVTRSVQEVHLDKQITLLDSPGVVFADPSADGVAAAALRNCIKVEQLEDPVLPVSEVVRRCPVKQLMAIYGIPAFSTAEELLMRIAEQRGKLRRGGGLDLRAAAMVVLQDWNSGKIPYYTVPPTRETHVAGSAALVPEYAAEFDTAKALAGEQASVIAELPSLEGGTGMYFATSTFGQVRAEGLDEEDEEADVGDEEAAPAKKAKQASDGQTAQLYGADGQYNPHAARAGRKRREKAAKRAVAMKEDDGSDFEF